MRIDHDAQRFRKIVKGKIRGDLKKFISSGEMMGKEGKHIVKIPIPHIDIPNFRFGDKEQGGVGQGEGEEGQPLSPEEAEEGEGHEAGKDPGQHVLEVEVSLEELAEMLGEELELPKIEPKGKNKLYAEKVKFTGIRRTGPESLRHFKRTFREALKRQIASGEYDYEDPIILPIRDDKRYRSWRINEFPENNAVVIYMMDVSGSMGEEQKQIVRLEAFWIDTWLKSQYDGLVRRFIIHDSVAREVDEHTFFHTAESGGTMISSAYQLCAEIILSDYPIDEWNIYPFHFSDGDNWSTDDSQRCFAILEQYLLPSSNQFSYGQVESPYGSGKFIKELQEKFPNLDEAGLALSEIKTRDAIMQSIKDFLGKGR